MSAAASQRWHGAVTRAAMTLDVAPSYLRTVLEREGVLSPLPRPEPTGAVTSVPPDALRGARSDGELRQRIAHRLRRRAGVIGAGEPLAVELLELAAQLELDDDRAVVAEHLPADAALRAVHDELDLLLIPADAPIPFMVAPLVVSVEAAAPRARKARRRG